MTLHWQALGQITGSYKFFVHLLRDGKVVAQYDAIPDANSYLTLWWAPREVVSETILLDVSETGTYSLTTGFYDVVTTQRLPVIASGAQTSNDAVVLGDVEIK